MDLSLIKKDITNIINNNNKYSNIIVLYSLGVLELFVYIKEFGLINKKFIKYLKIINKEFKFKNKINYKCLNSLAENKTIIKLELPSSDSESSGDIFCKINNMLEKDSNTVKKILDKFYQNKFNSDDYGEINHSLIKSAKNLFNTFDKDGDGFISSIEAIKIYEIYKKNLLCLNCNLEETLVSILINNNYKIDFENFFTKIFL